MIKYYKDKQGRRYWQTYCETCQKLVGDNGHGKEDLPWENKKSEICPVCGGPIFKGNDAPTDKKE